MASLIFELLGTLDPLLDSEIHPDKIYIFTTPETRGRPDEEDAFRAMDTVREILLKNNIRYDALKRKSGQIDGVRISL